MLLHAVASVLPRGAPLWVAGNADEGAEGAAGALAQSVGPATLLSSKDGAVVWGSERAAAGAAAAASPRGAFDGWRGEAAVRLLGGPEEGRDWRVFPGLFAGGGLDIMTSAMLAALPPLPRRRARVLDACCGSGVIGAALLQRDSSLRLHLLDADALALAAAAENVPQARRLLLCSGWPDEAAAFPRRQAAGRRPARYDWIVSNPPVHRGQPDCFDVLVQLIRGARRRLRPRGVLWLVAQEQVPVGRLLALHGSFEWVKADVSEDGRFVTWSAGGRAAGPRLAAPDGRLRKRAEEWLAAEQAEAEPEGARAGDQPRKRQRV